MPRTTRSTKASTAVTKESSKFKSKSTSSKYHLESRPAKSSRVFILPTKATADARIVTLPHPRDQTPSRYLVCPEAGIFEFKKVSAPKNAPRSWLLHTQQDTSAGTTKTQGQTASDAELFIATPIDPVFLVIPALIDLKSRKDFEDQKRLFRLRDDLFDSLPEDHSHLQEILQWPKTRELLEKRMDAICDTVPAEEYTTCRLSVTLLLELLINKAEGMAEDGLPTSLEEKFVTNALKAPMVITSTEITNVTIQNVKEEESGESTPSSESFGMAPTPATVETSESACSTAATSFIEDPSQLKSAIEPSNHIINLQRLRTAFEFICGSYIPPVLSLHLRETWSKGDSYNFHPLDEYLKTLAKLRSEATASRSMGDYSRKHGRDEAADEAREEKKRKMEEEKKKKANQSRGVRELKKVDTTGMKKLSAFFTKK